MFVPYFQFEENKRLTSDPYLVPHKLQREKENRPSVNKYEKHKEGVAKAYSTIKLQPLKSQQNNEKNSTQPVWSKGSPTGSTAATQPVHGEYLSPLQYSERSTCHCEI